MFYFCSSCIQIMFKFKPCSHYVQVFGEKFELCSHFIQLLFKCLGGQAGEAKFVQYLFMAEVNQYHPRDCIHQLFKLCSYTNYIQALFIHYLNSKLVQTVQDLFICKLYSYFVRLLFKFKHYSNFIQTLECSKNRKWHVHIRGKQISLGKT